MKGNVNIIGEIGVDVHLKDIVKQVQDQKDALEYNVFINSVGGYVDVGFDIYNYLQNINKPITTIGNGYVCSIATVIFLAGEKRILKQGTSFMIHNPSGGIQGTSEDIENYNNKLKEVENKIIDFYNDKTLLSKDALVPFLKEETFFTLEEALSFGFVTEIPNENITASFKINNNNKINNNINNNNKMNLEDKNWLEKWFQKIDNILNKPKNIMLIDSKGEEIDFPQVEVGLNPKVGDKGEIKGGEKLNGDYIFPSLNNAIVTFENGVIIEIKEDTTEKEKIIEENKNLKKEILDLTDKLEIYKNQYKILKDKMTSTFDINIEKDTIKEKIDTRLEKLKNKYIKK